MSADDAVRIPPCPMPSAHRRLMDCHAQWHQMHEAYLDPHAFRYTLNAVLQDLRNVTFLLQKQKAQLVGYDEWYPRFLQEISSSEIMRWAKNSRNRITKEADLELLSELQVEWHQDWLRRAIGSTSKYPPRMSVREVITDVRRRYNPPFGTMTVRRRWVDKALPAWELLDATSESYVRLEALLAEAHAAAGVPLCDLEAHDRECITPNLRPSATTPFCMVEAKDNLEAHYSLVDGAEIELTSWVLEDDEEEQAKAVEHYGVQFEFPGCGPIEAVPKYMAIARQIMETDGSHMTMAFLYRGESLVRTEGLVFPTQGSKILAFERLASQVKALKADGVLVISEIWVARPTKREEELGTVFFPARDRLDRLEALSVYAATRDGRRANQFAMVTRDSDGRAVCAEPDNFDDLVENTLNPIVRVWAETASAAG